MDRGEQSLTKNMADIIIVEDNKEIGTLLARFLEKEGFNVCIATTGEKALDVFEREGARLVILDICLPGIDGFAVCSKIRDTSNTHIMIASARTDKTDMLKGLGLGADDYIEKPYDVDILIAKVKGVFKRKYAMEEIVSDEIRISTVKNIVYVDDKQVEMTIKEYELLKLFMENKGVTLKKEYIFNSIWGYDSESEFQTLTVHIKWLRQKIEKDTKKPKHILTEWGVGYRFE